MDVLHVPDPWSAETRESGLRPQDFGGPWEGSCVNMPQRDSMAACVWGC